MGIVDTIVSAYDGTLAQYGNDILIYSGLSATLDDDYGSEETITWGGSSYSKGVLTAVTPEERQTLPEGYSDDEILNLLGKTTDYFSIGARVRISGATTDYEIVQLTNIKMLENKVPYQKMRVRRL